MIIYLGHSNANFASEIDGHVLAARWCDFDTMLYSFIATNGKEFPIAHLPNHERQPHHELPCNDGSGVESGDDINSGISKAELPLIR